MAKNQKSSAKANVTLEKKTAEVAKSADEKVIFSKDDIVKSIAEKYNLSIKQSKEIVTDIFDTIVTKTAENAKVSIYGFGIFEAVNKGEKTGINPRTKEKIAIAARRSPKFKASKSFKDIVDGKTE